MPSNIKTWVFGGYVEAPEMRTLTKQPQELTRVLDLHLISLPTVPRHVVFSVRRKKMITPRSACLFRGSKINIEFPMFSHRMVVVGEGGGHEREGEKKLSCIFLKKKEKQQLQREQKLLQRTKSLSVTKRSCSGCKLLLMFITTEDPSVARMPRTDFSLHHVTSKVSSSLNQTLALSPVIVFPD